MLYGEMAISKAVQFREWGMRLAIIGSLFVIHSATATNYEFSGTFDLSQFQTNAFNGSDDFFLHLTSTPSFTLNPGDTISGVIEFANGLSVKVSDPTGTGTEHASLTFSTQGNGADVQFTSSVQLFTTGGQLLTSNPQSGPIDSENAIESPFDLKSDPSIAFDGFSYSITITSNSGTATGTDVFSPTFLEIVAPSGKISVVPEPSALPLAATGCGLLGLIRRRRDQSSLL